MKGLNVRSVFALCLMLALTVDLSAQSGRLRQQAPPRHQETDEDDPVRLRVEEVLLAINVRNAFGKLPVDLKSTDFIVNEDGQRHEVNDVVRTPANILFVLDTSGEENIKNINLHRDLALKMIDALGKDDRAAIITYGDTIQLLSAWTGNKTALRQALEWNFKPSTTADLYNSLIYGCDKVLSVVQGRRSIVLLTDGIDSYEKPVAEGETLMFEQALAALHHARTTLYVAGQNEMLLKALKPQVYNALSWYERLDPLQRKKIDRLRRYYRQLEAAELSLRGLAEETGGMAWMPETREAYTAISNPMVEEIGTECVIAYSTQRTPADAGFHMVKVYGTRTDISIRCRRGIYANAESDKPRIPAENDKPRISLVGFLGQTFFSNDAEPAWPRAAGK
jgi:VWFA-related protein